MPSPLKEWDACIFCNVRDIPRRLVPFVLKACVYDGAPAGFPFNLSLSWRMLAFRILRWKLIIWLWTLEGLELQEPVSSLSKPRATGPLTIFFFKFLYLFLERGEGRGRETSMSGCLSRNTSMGPGPQPRHRISDPLVHRPALSPLSHISQGWLFF